MLFMCPRYLKARQGTSVSQRSESGFALVLSLVLMAFLLLLMVSLSVFITVEVQASRTNNLQQQARQNAVLALNTALAELQRVAGPDQRVTARADILESRSDIDSDDPDDTVANRYYTAVWDVSPAGWPDGLSPAWPIAPGTLPLHNRDLKPYFLVSGNEGHVFSTSEAPVNQGTTNFNNKIDFDEIGVTVEGVNLRDSDGQRTGTYAWWVGDEGVKAKITLRNPEEVLARPNPALLSPGGNPALLHSSLSGFDFMDEDAANDLTRVYHPGDLRNVDSVFDNNNVFDSSDPRRFKFYHDISLYSMGVLADVRNGGLKKDLSPTFGMGATVPDEVADAEPLFLPDPNIVVDNDFLIFKPTFGQLRSYYRAENVEATPPDGATVITGPNSWENSPVASYRMGSDTVSGVAPVVVRAQNSVTPFVVADYSEGALKDGLPLLRLYYAFQPIIMLWNPYDTAISTPRMIAFEWSVMATNTPYAATGHPLDGVNHRFRLFESFNLPTGAESLNGETSLYDLRLPQFAFELPSVVIPAGRAVIFSPPPYSAGQAYYNVASNRIPLEVGYNPTGHFVHVATHIPGAEGASTAPDNIDDVVAFWCDPAKLGDITYTWGKVTSSNRTHGLFNSSGQMWDFIGLDENGDPLYDHSEPLFKTMQLSEFVGSVSGSVGSTYYTTTDEDEDNPSGAPKPANLEYLDVFDWADVENLMDHRYLRFVMMKFPGETDYNLTGNTERIRWLRDFNMRAEWSSAFRAYNSGISGLRLPGMYISGFARSPGSGSGLPPDLDKIAFATEGSGGTFVSPWGAGVYSNPGQLIIHTIRKDDRPLWNMAELTHANLLTGDKRSRGGGYPRGSYNRAPTFPLGNSYVPFYLEYDSTMIPHDKYSVGTGYPFRAHLYDLSYLINEGLYDRYFLSGASSASANQLNPKLVFTGGDPTLVNVDNSITFDDTAASFLMDGTFNVNSTSREAWRTFLGGLRNTPVELRDGATDGGVGSGTPTVQLPSPTGVGLNAGSLESASLPEISVSYRRMSDAELDVLAEQIVRQIKLRGPFPSMSAFVNRVLADPASSWDPSPLYRNDLNADDRLELAESGALQAALGAGNSVNEVIVDNTETSNHTMGYLGSSQIGAYQSFQGSVAQGLSAFVMQSDLLSQMDSMMNVRSDTFTIIAYGDVRDPLTGNKVAEAKCEAIVQRLPEYLVPDATSGDPANADPYNTAAEPALKNPINQEMGRRFTVVAFRWL